MELLVCGLHRSGTSALARLVAAAAAKPLLDDPHWAITDSPIAYRRDVAAFAELERHTIVKCPRMAEILTDLCDDFADVKIAYALRDPRDIWCSIQEKIMAGMPTRMLDYRRLGIPAVGVQGMAEAYCHYLNQLELSRTECAGRIIVVPYELFFVDKPWCVKRVCEFNGWECRLSAAEPLFSEQLSPPDNKARDHQAIRGPGRWKEDLDIADGELLVEAVAYYQRLSVMAMDELAVDSRLLSIWPATVQDGDWRRIGRFLADTDLS